MKCRKKGCKANSLKNDKFCFFHSQKPDIIVKRHIAQSRGGSKNKRQIDPVSIKSLTDIRSILHETLNEIRSSGADNTISRSRAIAYICLILANIHERIDLEKRIEDLEKRWN